MAVIRSLWTDIPAHEVAQRFMHTGSLQLPKPSMGSWVVYGLGTENQNMPGFITLGGAPEWRQASFLPGVYQGCNVNYNTKMDLDDVIMNIKNQFTPMDRQRRELDLVHQAQRHPRRETAEGSRNSRPASNPLKWRSRCRPRRPTLSTSPRNPTRRANCTAAPKSGAKLLIARRLVERGVRFVQVDVGGWDHHGNLAAALKAKAGEIDGPAAALIKDLKQNGMLDSTLIIWGGEFGRTVTRDRNGSASPGPRSQRPRHGRLDGRRRRQGRHGLRLDR